MGHSVGKSLQRERVHEASIAGADKRDHVTKRSGGTPTHAATSPRFKVPELGPKDRDTVHVPRPMDAVVRAATGAGATGSGPSPSDVNGNFGGPEPHRPKGSDTP